MIRQAPPTDRGTDWRDLALCAIHPDKDLWFPPGDSPRYAEQVEKAKRICQACPVIWQCATWATERQEPHGVWGGLSERDRRRLHAKSARYRLTHRHTAA